VLLCLLDNNFTDFLRIGSVKKIAKPVLPYTTGGRDNATEEIRELREMLKQGDLTAAEQKHIKDALTNFTEKERATSIKEAFVIGTIFSLLFCLRSDFFFF